MQKNEKNYVRVPWKLFTYQWGVFIAIGLFVFVKSDIYIFGLPLESFVVSWLSFAIILVSTFVYILVKNRGDEE